MDTRHRVYYLVNLNQNHTKQGWWSIGWDSYGLLYDRNLRELKKAISSLKIRPVNEKDRGVEWYSLMVSCKKEEQAALVGFLDKTRGVNYVQLVRI